jgi:hypothetical protein
MFKHSHLEKRLREHGRAATAEILSIKTEGDGSSWKAMFSDDGDLTTTWFNCRLKLRVDPDGEPPFEATVHTRLNTIKSAGDTVPVLYDPDRHDVFVDYEADARAKMDAMKPGPALPEPPRVANSELELLTMLHERGGLSDEAFEAEKRRITGGG